MEAREQNRKLTDEFKLSVLSADPLRWLPVLYPEMAQEEATEEDVSGTEGGEFVFQESVTPEQAEALLAEMSEGSMGLTEFEEFGE